MTPERSKTTTKGVDRLLGNPKKALVRLGIPNSITLLVTVIYQISDIVWISGLGVDALAVLGFLMPFLFFIIAIAQGLGTGGGTKVAQYIGTGSKENADKTAAHTLLFAVITSIPVIILFIISLRPLCRFMGADRLLDTSFNLGLLYIPIIFFWIFNQAASGILQGEGDAKRAMFASLASLVLNIFLDPLFIYYFRMGIYGTAAASVVSSAVQFLLLIFWFFIKKNTYVACSFKGFKFDGQLSRAIIKLGLPVTLSQTSTSFIVFVITSIISVKAGTDGVAVYSTGIRFGNYVMLPTFGVSYAVIAIAAAGMGTRNYEKLKITHHFSLKINFFITLAIAIATCIFAAEISALFTWSKGSSRIAPDLTTFLKIYAWYFPAIGIWMPTIAFFIGIGYSIFDFLFNVLKHLLYTMPLVYLFAIVLNYGLPGIWTIIVIGMWIQSLIALALLRRFLSRYKKTGKF